MIGARRSDAATSMAKYALEQMVAVGKRQDRAERPLLRLPKSDDWLNERRLP
jgi:hypothetical protein